MKQLFIQLTLSLLIALNINAQVKEGVITYERKVNMHKRIQDEQMKAMMPEFRVSKYLLLFSDSISIYKSVPEDESPDPFDGGGGMRMSFKMPGEAGEIYKNFSLGKMVEQTEFFSKTFIIEDSIKKQSWKLTGETKKIMGHNCFKATTKQTVKIATRMFMGKRPDENKSDSIPKTPELKDQVLDVAAWFAEDIISPIGPENNGGLPGAILLLDINNGESTFTAIDINLTVNKKDIKQPTKGKKVTREEYRNTIKEMMSNFGPPGGGRHMQD